MKTASLVFDAKWGGTMKMRQGKLDESFDSPSYKLLEGRLVKMFRFSLGWHLNGDNGFRGLVGDDSNLFLQN